jgi:membrane associated rhomboid family serine protease
MIRVREGDTEYLISIDEFEARARTGDMSPFAWVNIPTLTGDRFVQARELPLFVALYDPRRLHFRRHFALGRLPIITGLVALVAIVMFFVSRHVGEGVVTRDALLLLGAKARSRILEDGEAWRLLAANVLHRDGIHLLFNLFALLNVGTVLEGVYRRGDYVLLLVVSGLATMTLSAGMSGPVTVGASGLVFGCLGAAVIFGWRYGDVLPLRYRLYFGVVVVGYAAVMFYLGLRSGSTDNWGHAGGLAAGVVMGGLLTPRLLRLTDAPREPVRIAARPWALAAGICVLIVALGGPMSRLFLTTEDYEVDAFGVVLERPSHWTKVADPLGFLTFGNGVDAFASLGCADLHAPSRLDAAVERFVDGELRALARGGHIGSLEVRQPQPDVVGRGEHARQAVRVRFSFLASDGPLDASALLFARGQLECALVLAARPTAPRSSEGRLERIRERLRFAPTRVEVLARRGVTGRPNSPRAWLELALAHQRAGAFDEARDAFDIGARFVEDEGAMAGQVHYARARFELRFAQDAGAAVEHARRAVEVTGGDRDAQLLFLESLLARGDLEDLRAHLATALEKHQDDPAFARLAKRLEQQGGGEATP